MATNQQAQARTDEQRRLLDDRNASMDKPKARKKVKKAGAQKAGKKKGRTK